MWCILNSLHVSKTIDTEDQFELEKGSQGAFKINICAFFMPATWLSTLTQKLRRKIPRKTPSVSNRSNTSSNRGSPRSVLSRPVNTSSNRGSPRSVLSRPVNTSSNRGSPRSVLSRPVNTSSNRGSPRSVLSRPVSRVNNRRRMPTNRNNYPLPIHRNYTPEELMYLAMTAHAPRNVPVFNTSTANSRKRAADARRRANNARYLPVVSKPNASRSRATYIPVYAPLRRR